MLDDKNFPALLTDAAAVLSSATYRSLASNRPAEAMERLHKVAPLAVDSGAETIADAFDVAHETLFRNYRNEYVFKNAVVSNIVFGRHKPTTTSAILELPLGRSFADVAVFNGTSTVYEIKTDFDSFARLASQLEDYRTRVEMVYVVVSEGRVASTERHLPAGVGLIALRKRGALSVVHAASSNLDMMRSDHIFDSIRQSEAMKILREHGKQPSFSDPFEQWNELRQLFSNLDIASAHRGAVDAYRARSRNTREISSHPSLPKSARALAYSASLSGVAIKRLTSRLVEPLATIRDYQQSTI